VAEEADPARSATAVVEMVRAGRFAELEELFAAPLRAVVSAETVRLAWMTEISRSGSVRTVGEPVSEPTQTELVRVSVPVHSERGELVFVMSVDRAGMLHGLRLAATASTPWVPPSYARPKRFAEHDVTVGEGPLAVGGIVSLPRGHGRVPGVVLLSGGGPFDRDATSGVNKPLKDLAWGLASRGIAVVRFDKVTYRHQQVMNAPGFTMAEEYVPHAVAAVRLLQQQPTVDPTRVFLLGHSMGGKAAPRVATADPSVAGLVILAGDALPMHHSAVRVTRYLASLEPHATTAEAAVEAIARQAALIDSADLSPSTPAAQLPFGLPASYWLDLRGYDPVSTATALDKPMLILQGGRDYQVTVDDDLALWRTALAHRPQVTIRVYENDNHLFFAGTGPSTPAEYQPAQHIDATVITDIVQWLTPGRRCAMRRM
jgi:dienelactone hydrolase